MRDMLVFMQSYMHLFFCVLYLIYGNESWNGRSSCLNIKMENDDNALLMGIDGN